MKMEQIPGYPVWIFDGPPVSFFGFAYPTRMTVIALSGGRLWVHSPIHLDKDLRVRIDELGKVAYLVSPNKLHYLFLSEWKEAYPHAEIYASPGLRRRRKRVSFDHDLADAPPSEWAGEIDQVIVHGSWAMGEVEFFHCASKSLILTDLIQKLDPTKYGRVARLLMKADNLCAPDGQAPREWRWTFFGNRNKVRHAVHKMLDWNPDRVVIAHGEWCRSNGNEFLRDGFRWVLG
jgi:hypothetical protein